MNWKTIYVTGKGDFWEDIKDKLLGSKVQHMVGSIEQIQDGNHRGLYWLTDMESLNGFKQAIGAELIWKYRLRFQDEAETELKNARPFREGFTERERSLIQKMRSKFKKRAAA